MIGEAIGLHALFVYGTLMRGQERHDLLSRHRPRSIEPARLRGRLLDLGGYPGLVDVWDADGEVEGELVRFAAANRLFAELDEYEGFRGHGVPGSLFERILTEVHTDDATCAVWTYVYAADPGSAPVIASGDWRLRTAH